jgi:hypothetical protein
MIFTSEPFPVFLKFKWYKMIIVAKKNAKKNHPALRAPHQRRGITAVLSSKTSRITIFFLKISSCVLFATSYSFAIPLFWRGARRAGWFYRQSFQIIPALFPNSITIYFSSSIITLFKSCFTLKSEIL